MQTIATTIQSLSEALLPALASLAVWATILLAAACLATTSLRHRPAAVRCCVWQCTFVGLAALPLIYAVLPGAPLGFSLLGAANPRGIASANQRAPIRQVGSPRQDQTRLHKVEGAAAKVDSSRSQLDRSHRSRVVHSASAQPQPAASPPAHDSDTTTSVAHAPGTPHTPEIRGVDTAAKSIHWPTILIVAWALGIAANLAKLAMCVVAARRMLKDANPVAGAASFGGASWQLALPAATAPILVSPNTQIPIAIGILRPRILLPESSVNWPPARLAIALAHEQAHVERRDVLWQLIARVVATIYWFHPLAWLALRKLQIERERACDDRVLLAGVPPHDYAAGLVEVAAALRGRNVQLLGGLGMVDRSQLAGRIRSILNASLLRGVPSLRFRLAILVTALFLVTVIGGVRLFDPIATATTQAAEAANAPPAQGDEKETVTPTEEIDVPEDHTTTSGAMLVQVVGPDGEPIEGARIHASVWSDIRFPGNQKLVTDKEGLVLVRLPRVLRILRLWSRYEGHVPLFASWQPESQKDGREIPEVFTFPMQKGTRMGGIVANEQGEPIEGVTVEVRRDSGGVQEDTVTRPRLGTWLAEGDGPDGALITDAEGRWQLNNVPAGDDVEIRVKLSHPDYIDDERWGGLQREQKVLMQAFREQTATIAMQQGISVTGKVTDPEGNPVERAVVVWGRDPYFQTGSQEVLTDENGVYRFPPLPPREEAVTVIARGWMPDLQEVEISRSMAPVNFQLKRGKTVRFRFVDTVGNPIPNVGVGLGRWRGGESLYNNRHPNVVDTGVPDMADENGVYAWTWAPDDLVEFKFWHKDFTELTLRVAPDGTERVQVLEPVRRVRGRVTDAVTGDRVEQFTLVPIEVYPDGQMRTWRYDAAEHTGGFYSFTIDDSHPTCRLQLEAVGYRTALSDAIHVGDVNPTYDFRLEPAPHASGRVIADDGTPIVGAHVFLASRTQQVTNVLYDSVDGNLRVTTDEQGEFAFPAQAEPYTIVVVHNSGYAVRSVRPDEGIGDIVLDGWAHVTGVYYDKGNPVPSARISLYAIGQPAGTSLDILNSVTTETDEQGRFAFTRVMPAQWQLRPHLSGGWEGSREAAPLDISTGDRVQVNLGEGTRVVGRVALTGTVPRDANLAYSHNHLFRRADGIDPPEEIAALGYDWRHGWKDDWFYPEKGKAYFNTLHHYDFETNPDGTFVVDGVPAGEYELALRVFAPPEGGMNLYPIAKRSVRFSVPAADIRLGTHDVGLIEMETSLGLQPGDLVPNFQYQTLDGGARQLEELRGRHMLIHFWESQRDRGFAKLPEFHKLYDEFHDNEGLVIVGLSFDRDLATLRRFQEQRNLPWEQGFLGFPPATDVPERLGIFNFPTFFLIDPGGKLVHKGHSPDEVREHLDTALRQRNR